MIGLVVFHGSDGMVKMHAPQALREAFYLDGNCMCMNTEGGNRYEDD